MAITRLSGGITPGDGADPRTFPAIWNDAATQIESAQADINTAEATITSQGSAISALEADVTILDAKNIPSFGTAIPTNGQLLTYSTAVSAYVPQDASAGASIINTDGDPGTTIYVGSVDPDVSYTPATGDVWIEVP